ncbi:cupredoxin domain-containing protein [Candidatus Nomurabacteria bacterium]|nr:cupredoxin domain-containing protein [Candidatus Nomurabacteria bacterium]
MNKTGYIIIILALVVAIGIIFSGGKESTQSVEIKDGVQYVRIDAGGGYSPQITEAKGGMPTKLIVKTNGTYDCSASLVIRSVGFQEILPPTGEKEIDLGTPKVGETTQGVCGMGMYSFKINFS